MGRVDDWRGDDQRLAREYIDKIVAINRRYGMGSQVPQQTYDRAVKDAARLFRIRRPSR